jgi:hypothetical protein
MSNLILKLGKFASRRTPPSKNQKVYVRYTLKASLNRSVRDSFININVTVFSTVLYVASTNQRANNAEIFFGPVGERVEVFAHLMENLKKSDFAFSLLSNKSIKTLVIQWR